ncbi:MAG: hypothetical protein HY277_01720, partial [Ignavibacteriales bacterium]|nr:hypothetical protein [Ignavibacteriales bacterium]
MSSSIRCLIAFMTFTLSPPAWSQETPNDARMNDYDVDHYDLSISFDIPHKSFNGTVMMEAHALTSLSKIVLNVSNRTLTIDSVSSGTVLSPFSHREDRLVVGLASAIPPHAPFAVSVSFHGISAFEGDYDDGGVYFTPNGRVATSSEPLFARTWWPCKDLPSDKATARVTITVPDRLTAVSNGILTRTDRQDGVATYTWETRYPIATYLIAVSAAEYREFSTTYKGLHGEKMPIRYFVFPEDYEKAKIDFENTPTVLEFFAQTFCEYPFVKEKFGYVEVEGNLTMENQTLCSITDSLIKG